MDLGSYLKKSIGSGIARSVVNALVAALLIPLIVARVGLETYGAWALVLIFSNLSGVADLGLAKSLVYFIPKQHDDTEKSKFYSAGFLLNSLMVLILALIGGAILMSGVDIWGGSEAISHEIGRAILGFGVLIACTGVATSVYRAVLESYYLISWVNVGYVVLASLTYVLVYILSLVTDRVEYYIASTAAAHLIVLLYHIILVRVMTGARLRRARVDVIKRIAKYALGFFSLGAINVSVKPLNRYLLMVISGDPAMHGIFDIGLKIGRAAFGLLSSIATPIYSVFSAYGKERLAEINRILNRYLAWSAGLYIFGCTVFYVGGSFLIERFAAVDDIRLMFKVSLIMVIGNASFGLAEPFSRAFWGLGDLSTALKIKILQPIANVALIVALSAMAPIYRFSWSFSVAFALSALAMVVVFKLKHGSDTPEPASQ